MSDPITNLTQKFAALAAQLDAQHAATLAALAALRGAGPDNSLERVTAAIFALAGPAPGITLADLHTLIAEGLYTQPMAPLNLRIPYLLGLKSNTGSMNLADWLEQIHIDIAGIEQTPSDGLNLDPALCGTGFTYESRALGFTLVGTFEQSGITYDSYAPNSPTYPILAPVVNAYNAGSVADVFLDPNVEYVSVCLSWDWTGMATPAASWQLLGTAGVADIWPTGAIVTDERSITGQYPRQLYEGNTVSYRFAVPTGQALLNNVFWHAKIVNFGAS